MKYSTKITILLLTSFIIASSHAFIHFERGKNYVFNFRSETCGIKNWFTLNQSIDTEVQVRKISDNSIKIRLKNIKITDEIDKPTSDELKEVSNPFIVVQNGNNSFNKFLTKEKAFVYCLKLKYRIVDLLMSDMSRFTKMAHLSTVTKIDVKNLAFGDCSSKVKVVKNKDEVKVGVKAEYKDCHNDGRVNLATIFDLSPNSTTAAIVTIKSRENVVKKINVLSDMMTYNMGGIHMKIRSSMTFKGVSDVEDGDETGSDFKVISCLSKLIIEFNKNGYFIL